MSYRKVEKIETVCDNCGHIKSDDEDGAWMIWQSTKPGEETITKHNCPACADLALVDPL